MVACSDEIIVVSPTLKAYLEKNYGVDSTFIPNGVTPLPDADAGLLKKYGIGDKKFFLCVARLVPEKGLHFAVKALSSGLDIDLVIAGESGFGDDYAKHLRASAGPHVKFIGHADRHALAALYKRAEALLVPSTVEGMPLVVLEAMSAGCAVLASDIPELKAAAGDCSFYFRSENSEDLRLQIDRFLADDKGKSEKIKLGLSRSKDYNWANITTKTLSVYERAVTRAKR